MITAIFAFLGQLLALVVGIVTKRRADAANPEIQDERRTHESDRAIVEGDEDSLNRITDDHLRWLQNRRGADRGGPGDAKG